jgi:hypothetical protein
LIEIEIVLEFRRGGFIRRSRGKDLPPTDADIPGKNRPGFQVGVFPIESLTFVITDRIFLGSTGHTPQEKEGRQPHRSRTGHGE